MNLKPKSLIRIWLQLSLVLLLTLFTTGCDGNGTPTPTPVPTNTPEPPPPTAAAPPEPPTLDRSSEITLDAGDQMAVNASSEGAASFKWKLQGNGNIDTDTGSTVIYTAPDGEGGLAVLNVIAYNAAGLASPTTSMTITVEPGEVTLIDLKIDTPKEEAVLIANQRTDCTGIYELSYGSDTTGIYVWILAGDTHGNYFLQNPPILFDANGTWSTYIQVDRGITKLLALQVTEEGNEAFKKIVKTGDFKGFTDLPEDSIILHTISIQS